MEGKTLNCDCHRLSYDAALMDPDDCEWMVVDESLERARQLHQGYWLVQRKRAFVGIV